MSWQQVVVDYSAMNEIERAVRFGMLWRQLEIAKSYVRNTKYIDQNDLEIILGMKKPKDTETGDQ